MPPRRSWVVSIPSTSADRAPVVGMLLAAAVCAAAGFAFVRWVGGPIGDDEGGSSSPAVAGLDDEDVAGPGGTSAVASHADAGSRALAAGDDEAPGDDDDETPPPGPASPPPAPVADAGPAVATTPPAQGGSGPTAGRIAYVRCEVGAQNADGTWPPCPRFREIELAAARAVPRLAGCPGMPGSGRGFDVRILYRRGRSHPSLVVLPSSAPWAEQVASCVRERFTGLPPSSSVDGNLTVAVRVQPAGGPPPADAPDAPEPPPPPATPTPGSSAPSPPAPTPAATPAPPAPSPPPAAPSGAGPDGVSADYRPLARPRPGTVRGGAILRDRPRDGTQLERPAADERVEVLGFDRGWVHVRWRGRSAWVFQTWMAQ